MPKKKILVTRKKNYECSVTYGTNGFFILKDGISEVSKLKLRYHHNHKEENLDILNIDTPTPFKPNGEVDKDGMKRVIDCMVDQKVDGICILANYSEQFLLSDEEREILTKLCIEHVAGRVPVITTVSHFSTDIAL